MKKSKRESVLDSTARLQRAARERADDQARRIPWQRLYHARNQYIDWQEFYLWVRSILEVEDGIPNWLVEILNDRCAGFLQTEKAVTQRYTANDKNERVLVEMTFRGDTAKHVLEP